MLHTLDKSPLLERLRRATQEAHDGLDRLARAHDFSTPEGYARLLMANCAAVLPLERLLDVRGADSLLPDWAQRRRSIALSEDLADLGLGPVEDPCPAFEGEAEVLGALYVLEGSRLGGRFIAAQLIHAGSSLPMRFFRHGQGLPLWPAFLDTLERAQLDEEACTKAENAACRAFAFFRNAFELHYL